MARILIIDDTTNIRTMMALTLSSGGHEVESAEEGVQGLAMFGDGSKWDLTLVDQQMPIMTGDEFVIEARKRDVTARIVMVTAFATPELAAQVIQSGAIDFLRKPFSADVLRDTVALALSQVPQSARAADFDSNPTLPQPGESDYPLPSVSWRVNGFCFWPFAGAPKAAHSPHFEMGRLFHVRAPDESLNTCFIGIAPHVRAQIEAETGNAIADGDAFWDKVCGQTLFAFLGERAQIPPDVLPVYEAPQQARPARRGVTWGAFFGG